MIENSNRSRRELLKNAGAATLAGLAGCAGGGSGGSGGDEATPENQGDGSGANQGNDSKGGQEPDGSSQETDTITDTPEKAGSGGEEGNSGYELTATPIVGPNTLPDWKYLIGENVVPPITDTAATGSIIASPYKGDLPEGDLRPSLDKEAEELIGDYLSAVSLPGVTQITAKDVVETLEGEGVISESQKGNVDQISYLISDIDASEIERHTRHLGLHNSPLRTASKVLMVPGSGDEPDNAVFVHEEYGIGGTISNQRKLGESMLKAIYNHDGKINLPQNSPKAKLINRIDAPTNLRRRLDPGYDTIDGEEVEIVHDNYDVWGDGTGTKSVYTADGRFLEESLN